MSDLIEVKLPQWGMAMSEGTILEWYRQAGEAVERATALALIETAKAQEELASPVTGEVAEILVAAGETVPIGTPLVRLRPAP